MLFRQFVDDDLGCASYLIGDETTKEAVVVDPAYAIEPYVEESLRQGLRLVRVLETHTHADHVSGHGRLALEHGLPVSIHPAAEPEYAFDALADGDALDVGEVRLRALHTPGHRPEHCCFVVGEEPRLLITGDSLLVGDAARPDLAVGSVEGAHGLYRSLQRLLELPDETEVYPGHVAGSLCGAAISKERSSTIGAERRSNRALAHDDEDGFVADSAAISAPRPPNLERIVALNRGPFLAAPAPLVPLGEAGEHVVLDVRRADEFAAGHVAGALHVPVSGSSFATRAGFVIPEGARVALHASSREDAERAARGLRAVGVLAVDGWLAEPVATEALRPVELDELERLVASNGVQIVDVREKDERDGAYIAGSRHVPYRVVGAFADDLRDGGPVVTICQTGSRASIAASVLAAAGVEVRPVIHGGIPEWERRGNDTVAFRRCGS